MARQFLTNIDLNKNELLNAKIQVLSSAPLSPVQGQIYFDSTALTLKQYNGTEWVAYTQSGDISNADIASDADIELSKLAVDPLARANHTGTQTASTISDFDTAVQTNTLDSLTVPVADVDLNNNKITNLATPTLDSDAANKGYVDAARSGLDVKASVRVATTTNITLSGTQTIDGVSVIAGDRVLVKNQTADEDNGIYDVSTTAWSRSDDADTSEKVTSGLFTFVEEGTTHGDAGFVLTTNQPIVLGTTPLSFTQFSDTGQVTAGDGLTKTGSEIDVVGTADRITVNPDSIDIASTYVGQSSITTLGTITTGVWNGTTLAIANGGTGATSASDARTNLGATTKFSASNPELTPTSGVVTWTVTHNLGTTDVVVSLKDLSDNAMVEANVITTSSTVVTISFNSTTTVTADSYRVVVVG